MYRHQVEGRGRSRGSITSLGMGFQDSLGMGLLAKPAMVNSPDIFHLRFLTLLPSYNVFNYCCTFFSA